MLMQDVDGYLALRRSLGFSLRGTEDYLRSFVRAAVAAHETHIVSSTAIRWAGQSSSEAHRDKRLRVVCSFARFMHAEDSRHEIPPDNVYCGQRPRVAPYIFTDEELRRISREARRFGTPGSLLPYTFDTLFSLIAATGMRPSEARNLRLADFSSEGIIVREAKFRKSRFLPLHPSSVASLEGYLKRRQQARSADDHIFISSSGRGYSEMRVREVFRRVLEACGIPGRPVARAPRLMDLRHTFAVRALETCPDGRGGVRQHTLALSTYMGHSHIRCTYWYLENTPELMRDIADVTEAFVNGGGK
jgi:integrase/recombinase XerD